ncbi:hypothetical protein [Caminicella sporogenes]|uniref:hypothetical protein n=1 Tax=Caminicella sporogenes TaxID=166485 RepID=UPI0025422B04|nr:hypothetical protein [Caminicella sporogenes]WIF94178.1 hypothetical protein QNI18_07645 [Caminicella sporogenes]
MLKNSKLFKRLVTTTLAVSLLIPSASFADTKVESVDSIQRNERLPLTKMKEFRGKVIDSYQKRHKRLISIVEKYAPEDLENWNSLFEEHKELREELKELRTRIKEIRHEKRNKKKQEIKKFRNELRSKVEAGEITVEESKDKFQKYVEEIKGNRQERREELKAKLQEKREQLKVEREKAKEVRQKLKEAIKADDTEKINELLDNIYIHLKKRIDFLKEKIQAIKERLEEIQD